MYICRVANFGTLAGVRPVTDTDEKTARSELSTGGGRAVQRSVLLSAPRTPSPFPFSHGFCAQHRPLQPQGTPVCQFPNMRVNSARATPQQAAALFARA